MPRYLFLYYKISFNPFLRMVWSLFNLFRVVVFNHPVPAIRYTRIDNHVRQLKCALNLHLFWIKKCYPGIKDCAFYALSLLRWIKITFGTKFLLLLLSLSTSKKKRRRDSTKSGISSHNHSNIILISPLKLLNY